MKLLGADAQRLDARRPLGELFVQHCGEGVVSTLA
jgi:hypothetical protein